MRLLVAGEADTLVKKQLVTDDVAKSVVLVSHGHGALVPDLAVLLEGSPRDICKLR